MFHWVALVVLELPLSTRLASNSTQSLPPSDGIKGVHFHAWLFFKDRVSCILGWPGTHYENKNDLELLNLLLGPCMISFVLGIEAMALCMLGSDSTDSATSEASGDLNTIVPESISVKANYSGFAPAMTTAMQTLPQTP